MGEWGARHGARRLRGRRRPARRPGHRGADTTVGVGGSGHGIGTCYTRLAQRRLVSSFLQKNESILIPTLIITLQLACGYDSNRHSIMLRTLHDNRIYCADVSELM